MFQNFSRKPPQKPAHIQRVDYLVSIYETAMSAFECEYDRITDPMVIQELRVRAQRELQILLRT